MRKSQIQLLIAVWLVAGAPTARAQSPAGGRARNLERLRTNLNSLNLSDDQRTKVNDLIKETGEKVRDIVQSPDADGRPAKLRDVMQHLRQQLAEILTADQLQTLREKMQQSDNNSTDQPSKPQSRPPTTQSMNMMEENAANQAAPVESPKIGPAASTPIATGKPAPDFELPRLDGQTAKLSALKNRVTVLIFGSYSCPTLRDRSVALNKLYRDYQGKANVFLIYTSEAHPVGGWEIDRNKLDNIQIQQATAPAARKFEARVAHDALHLAMPVLLDTMENTVATEYGGFPNGAIVIDRQDIVTGTQQWAESVALRHLIDEALAEPLPSTMPVLTR